MPAFETPATLRPAERRDVPGIQRVRHAVKENRLVSGVISDAQVVEAIERTGRGWIVEVDRQIVGFSVGNGQTGNVWALFVDPAHEGRGHGRRLHDTMVDWMWSCGLGLLWLSTDPATRAERLYERSGWQRCGLLPNGEVRFEQRAPAASRQHEAP